jgi:hypothetical protein
VWQWLSADPREVVDFAGAGALAAGVEERHLGDELRRWRGIVARRRLLALVRRHGAVALGLAAVLEALALLGAFPQWVVVAVPLVCFVVSVLIFASQGPSPFGLARLLDDKLGLNDRLATALEIEARGGQESTLERRTVADAAGLLAAGREDWHASAARAGRHDWSVLGGVVLALAVVVAIGLATGGTSSSPSSADQALGPKGGAGAPGGPNEQRKKRAKEKAEKHAAPTGKLHKIEGKKRSEISPVQTQSQGYQQIPQGKSTGRKGKAANAKASGKPGAKGQTGGKITNGSNSTPKGKQSSENNGKGPSTEASKEKEHPTVGFSVKGQKKHKGSGRKGSSEVSGAGTKKTNPNGQGDETSASSQAAPKSGTPTGAGKAGGEQGNNQQGHATQITGQASQAVKIQPGYAPSRSTKGGKERRKAPGDEEGAGGKARTAQVTGATQVGDEFSFVPAAGGAVPGATAGLQQNYLESLKWVARLPW